jgi:hypothetical protein
MKEGKRIHTNKIEFEKYHVSKVLDILFEGLKAFSVAWTFFMESYGKNN